MMNHYVKKDLSPSEAKEFIKKAVGITCGMKIMPSIFCVDSDKVWDEKEIAEKLSESFNLVSSF